MMIMLKSKTISILGLLMICVACTSAPSEEEVKRSIFTVMRGYEASTKSVDPLVTKEYGNGAELKFVSMGDTLVNEMKVLIQDDDSIMASGTCFFAGYEDPYSGYRVDGELTYDCERSPKNLVVCNFAAAAALTGSKVKQLAFSLEMDSDGNSSVGSVTVNGKNVGFHQWAFLAQIIRAFSAASFLNVPD